MRAEPARLWRRWEGLCRPWRPPPRGALEAFDRLLAAYTSPQRHYHGLDHIDECLLELDEARALARDAEAVETAIWFHDVVYDGRQTDNEEQSARVAGEELQRLGAPEPLRVEVARLIRLTRHDTPPSSDDADGRLIVDIDLASLARSPDVFDENTRLIRLEYPHVQDEEFRRGRRQLLSRFLARARIYQTDRFFAQYEQAARNNLQRALKALA